MQDTLDIQKVISTSTSNVSLDDLTKKGFKQVKVLNQAIITKLIGEAVDQVLTERAKRISKEERDKVINEARTQFESLAKKRLEKERSRIDELEQANSSLSAELDTLRKRLAASVELQASRDQAVARVNSLEGELARWRTAVPELELALAKERGEAERLRAELARKNTEVAARAEDAERLSSLDAEVGSLRQALSKAEKGSALLEGQLTAKNEELERAKSSGSSEASVEKLLEAVSARLGKVAQPADVSQILLSLDGLSRRLANISGGGGGAGIDLKELTLDSLFDPEKGSSVESNISKVKVKENKATGVKGALAKLKKLQQGGADGE